MDKVCEFSTAVSDKVKSTICGCKDCMCDFEDRFGKKNCERVKIALMVIGAVAVVAIICAVVINAVKKNREDDFDDED